MKINFTHVFLTMLCLLAGNARAQLVSLQNGKLVYAPYANQGQTAAVNYIPDFSNAGYRGGGVRLPDVPVAEMIEAVTGDNRAHIQAAIDRVSALPADVNGHRGALLLKAGVYPVEGQLNIRTSGVVLRGEGNGLNGTVLIATQKTNHNFIRVQGSGSGFGDVAGTNVRITSSYVATGAKTFTVAAGHTFQAGDKVVVQKTPNDLWIDTLQMRQYGWTAPGYKTQYERQVTAVNGNELTIDIPIVDPIDPVFGGGEVFKSNVTGRIRECGVENLRLESWYLNDVDESHAWIGIVFSRVENSWIRDVTGKYFGYGLTSLSSMSRFNTVQDCAMIDHKSETTGGRKYSFNLESNSSSNLHLRCKTWGGRHDLVSGSKVPGPNVFLDCASENTKDDIGPHHRWSTGQLYDNVYGGRIRVQNRGASGTGHGWAGAQILFWNIQSYQSDVKVESPFGARNWGIGAIGKARSGAGYWESWGTHVLPRSLYLTQLEERLGAQAVANIVTPAQMQGNVWDSLRAQAIRIAGEPRVAWFGEDTSTTFDLTDNGGIITGQYPNTSKPAENFTSLIDNSLTTKYYASGRKALWVQYQSPRGAIVSRYTITSANDVPERDPRDWRLLGSNDGVTWAVLDSQRAQTFSSRFLTRSFALDTNTTAYQYYRFQTTANNGHSGTQFAEWELWERRRQTISFNDVPPVTFGDDPFELVATSSSGLPVSIEVLSGPGRWLDSALHFLGAGEITVIARQGGNAQYFPDSAILVIPVAKAAQVLTFGEITPQRKGDTLRLTATASSGLEVQYSVVSGGGTITGNLLTLLQAGPLTVRASQPGNADYETAEPAERTLLVYADDYDKKTIRAKAYPNPSDGRFKVKIEDSKEQDYVISVFDNMGYPVPAVVTKQGAKMFSIDMHGARPGIYYVMAASGMERLVIAIVKM
ncbi:T9SS type A sorting domain-containing protein [Chitinophaga lutea]